ncbi:MAG: response regulator [Ignavibacteriota bacterium]
MGVSAARGRGRISVPARGDRRSYAGAGWVYLGGAYLAEPGLAGARIVVLISGARREEADRCRNLGVFAWLTKPAGEKELLEALTGSRKSAVKIMPSAGVERGPSQPGGTRRHLLVVEDNPVNALVARRVFEKANHTVKLAANGRRALELIEQEKFDCVLMVCRCYSGRL